MVEGSTSKPKQHDPGALHVAVPTYAERFVDFLTTLRVVVYNQDRVKSKPLQGPGGPGSGGLGDAIPAVEPQTASTLAPAAPAHLAPVSPFLDRLVTIEQLTTYYISLSTSTVAKLVREGVLPVVRVGDAVRFHPRTVLEILLQRGTITMKRGV